MKLEAVQPLPDRRPERPRPTPPPSAAVAQDVVSRLRETLRYDSALWRKAVVASVTHGPEALLRYSPPLFGWAFGAALAPQRRAVLSSLRLIHGTRPALTEMRDVAAVFANFAMSMAEAMAVGTDRGYRVTRRPINDWYAQSRIALGKGVILATAQTAGWDVVGGLLHSTSHCDVMVVMEREPNATAREMHDTTRHKSGVRVVHVGEDALASLPLLRHLRGGGVLALKFDRLRPGMRTLPVTFFGRPWAVPAGPLRLASLSGAPIVPCFTRRLGFLEYQPISCEPIYVARRATEEQHREAAQKLAHALEGFVRASPTQWIRFHED